VNKSSFAFAFHLLKSSIHAIISVPYHENTPCASSNFRILSIHYWRLKSEANVKTSGLTTNGIILTSQRTISGNIIHEQ
jgi:hypothetical protein